MDILPEHRRAVLNYLIGRAHPATPTEVGEGTGLGYFDACSVMSQLTNYRVIRTVLWRNPYSNFACATEWRTEDFKKDSGSEPFAVRLRVRGSIEDLEDLAEGIHATVLAKLEADRRRAFAEGVVHTLRKSLKDYDAMLSVKP